MQLKTSCTENISTITLSTSNRTSNLKKFVALPTTQSYTTKLTQASNGQTTHYQPLSHPTTVEPEPARQDIADEYEAAERYWLA